MNLLHKTEANPQKKCFILSQVFLDTAVVLADRLLPAFDTPTGLMENSINLHTGAHKIAPWSNHRATFSSFLLDEEGDVYKDLEVYSQTLARGVRAEFYGNTNDNWQHYVCLADGKKHT